MPRPRTPSCARLGALAAVAAALAGCGGAERQDEDRGDGTYRVEVVSATFPSAQQLAQRATLSVQVRNTDSETLPNVALTVKTGTRRPGAAPAAFGQSTGDERLADDERPVWIVDQGPVGGDTAYTNTWALGRLPPGATKTFSFQLTPVEAGRYTVSYAVAPGLDGDARLAEGSKASGRFRVVVDDAPVDSSVASDGSIRRR